MKQTQTQFKSLFETWPKLLQEKGPIINYKIENLQIWIILHKYAFI